MSFLFQRRQSIFNRRQLVAAVISYTIAGAALFFMIEWLEHIFGNWVFLIPAIPLCVLSFIWPSYCISIIGVIAFWLAPLLLLIVVLVSYSSITIEYVVFIPPYLFLSLIVLLLISLPWSLVCTSVAYLRLPISILPGYCQSCGYDLRGLPHARCPECGSINHETARDEHQQQ